MFAFHLSQFHVVLVDGLRFLVNLLLEGPRDLHHVFLVLLNLLVQFAHIFVQVLQAEGSFVKPNVQRGDVTGTREGNQVRAKD